MARVYEGNVSVAINTKNKIVVKPNAEGKYNQENVTDLEKTCVKVAKDRGALFEPFTPAAQGQNLQLVLLEGYGKSPYMARLPEQDEESKLKSARRKVEILDV